MGCSFVINEVAVFCMMYYFSTLCYDSALLPSRPLAFDVLYTLATCKATISPGLKIADLGQLISYKCFPFIFNIRLVAINFLK